MNKIKIEKGIPIPQDALAKRKKGDFYSAVLGMEPGDSIWMPGVKKTHQTTYCRTIFKRKGINAHFTTREIILDNVKGLRLWRVD